MSDHASESTHANEQTGTARTSSITYSTSQIAKIAGLHPNTVRMYEQRELIQKPARKQNEYRIYSANDMVRLRIVRALRCTNYSLSESMRAKYGESFNLRMRRQFFTAWAPALSVCSRRRSPCSFSWASVSLRYSTR